jgi:hypothetical protein
VEAYCTWAVRPETPSTETAQVTLAAITDQDPRMDYVCYLSARKTFPPGQANQAGPKLLLPQTPLDGTTLDAVMGRLLSAYLPQLSDAEVSDSIRICADHLFPRQSETRM